MLQQERKQQDKGSGELYSHKPCWGEVKVQNHQDKYS